jgi:hypothetical protein
MTDQLAWMQHELARYTYRPGWEMTISTVPNRPATLIVRYPAADSRNPGHERWFRAHRPIVQFPPPPGVNREEWFARTLQAILLDLEAHESREWLRRDGQLVDDPHTDPSRWQCMPCGVTGPPKTAGSAWTCDLCQTQYSS